MSFSLPSLFGVAGRLKEPPLTRGQAGIVGLLAAILLEAGLNGADLDDPDVVATTLLNGGIRRGTIDLYGARAVARTRQRLAAVAAVKAALEQAGDGAALLLLIAVFVIGWILLMPLPARAAALAAGDPPGLLVRLVPVALGVIVIAGLVRLAILRGRPWVEDDPDERPFGDTTGWHGGPRA